MKLFIGHEIIDSNRKRVPKWHKDGLEFECKNGDMIRVTLVVLEDGEETLCVNVRRSGKGNHGITDALVIRPRYSNEALIS